MKTTAESAALAPAVAAAAATAATQRCNTKNLGWRLAVDAAGAACAGAIVAPVISIIDRSIMENASGRSSLLASIQSSFRNLVLCGIDCFSHIAGVVDAHQDSVQAQHWFPRTLQIGNRPRIASGDFNVHETNIVRACVVGKPMKKTFPQGHVWSYGGPYWGFGGCSRVSHIDDVVRQLCLLEAESA